MDDNEINLVTATLDGGHPLLKFPSELEKKYIRYHAETRLIISNLLLGIGLSVFLLFSILDYIVFPFRAAVAAWIIRTVTAFIIILLIFYYKYARHKKIGHLTVSASVVLINTAVVSIDVIGVNTAGYALPLGSLFVILASCTLIRLPFWISLSVIGTMLTTQFTGLLIFTQLNASQILNIFFHFSFIILMLLFSSYSVDSDSRRIFLLNIFRKKYERSGLKKVKADTYVELLENYVRDHKPYLDPDLRIDDIARVLRIKRHHLTQIINEKYNKNFFTYINEFRVREAQKLMSDKNNADMTILRIVYDAGFNSKATFNRIFKEIAGQTPTEFRKKNS